MRMIRAASLVAVGGMLAFAPAHADTVPPFQGNDTGGIIAYSLTGQTDIRSLAIDHCAQYGRMYFDCAGHDVSLSRKSSIRKFPAVSGAGGW